MLLKNGPSFFQAERAQCASHVSADVGVLVAQRSLEEGKSLLPTAVQAKSISKLRKRGVQNGTLDQMFSQVRSRWDSKVASEFRYADIVAEDQKTAVRRFEEALKILKQDFAALPIGFVIFPRLSQG